MKTVKFKPIANILKINKTYLPDFENIIVSENQIEMNNFTTYFSYIDYFNFPIEGKRLIDKDIIDISSPNMNNTTKLHDQNNADVLGFFTKYLQGKKETIYINETNMNILYNAVNFVTKDDLRPVMQGILISNGICATDAHKLHYKNAPKNEAFEHDIILPVEFIKLLKALKIKNANFDIYKEYITFITPNITIISKLIEGKFPNWKAVIPINNNCKLTLDRKETLTALKKLAPIANKNIDNKFLIKLEGNNVILHTENLDYNISEAVNINTVNVDGMSDEYEISFNLKHFETCIKTQNNNIVLNCNENNNKAVLIGENCLLMPCVK